MGESTKIQWVQRPRADGSFMPGHTFNTHLGCSKVDGSPACRACYAEAGAKRAGWDLWGDDKPRRRTTVDYWKQPAKWNRAAKALGERHLVFVDSMSDVFEDRRDLDPVRADLWSMIGANQNLIWILLSKRWGLADIDAMVPMSWRDGWPDNVWALATVENQHWADVRIPALLRVPAVVRGLSIEPMFGAIDLDPPTCPACSGHDSSWNDGTPFCREHGAEMTYGTILDPCADRKQSGINWVIVGGGSGGAREELDLDAVRALKAQCEDAGTALYVKQMGVAWALKNRRPLEKVDLHGGDPARWDEDLRVREFPTYY